MGQSSRFAHLEAALTSAMSQCLKEARNYQTIDRKVAADKMREYKKYEQEMNVLLSRKNLSGAEPPVFRWSTKVKETVVEHLNLGDDQLVLMIEGLFDIEDLLVGHSSRAIVITYDLGVPKEEPITGKITGKVDTTGTAKLDYKSVLPILKRGRSIVTLFARKKATFEISLNRGMFFSPVVLGSASLPLAELNEKCECGGSLPIIGLSGKKKTASPAAGSIKVFIHEKLYIF